MKRVKADSDISKFHGKKKKHSGELNELINGNQLTFFLFRFEVSKNIFVLSRLYILLIFLALSRVRLIFDSWY